MSNSLSFIYVRYLLNFFFVKLFILFILIVIQYNIKKKNKEKNKKMGQRQELNGTAFLSAIAELCLLKEILFSFRRAP